MARLVMKLHGMGGTRHFAVDMPPEDVDPARLPEAAEAASKVLRRKRATRLGTDARDRVAAREADVDETD